MQRLDRHPAHFAHGIRPDRRVLRIEYESFREWWCCPSRRQPASFPPRGGRINEAGAMHQELDQRAGHDPLPPRLVEPTHRRAFEPAVNRGGAQTQFVSDAGEGPSSRGHAGELEKNEQILGPEHITTLAIPYSGFWNMERRWRTCNFSRRSGSASSRRRSGRPRWWR